MTTPAPASSDGKTLGVVGLILTFLPGLNLIGFILALVGRSQSKKAGVKNTPATVAVVLGIISIVIWVIIIIVAATTGGISGSVSIEG